jgi:hypothetical protein
MIGMTFPSSAKNGANSLVPTEKLNRMSRPFLRHFAVTVDKLNVF